MRKSEKKIKFERLTEIRKKYDQFMEADRLRKERNEIIIDKLHNIKNNWLSTRCRYPTINEVTYSGKTRVDLLSELGKSQNQTQCLVEPVTNFGERGFQNFLFTELSKHYILIPKHKHADAVQNTNKSETYLSTDDWKSKYEILKNLENNELKNKINEQTTRITTTRLFENNKSDENDDLHDITKLNFFPESQFHRVNAMREVSNVADQMEHNDYARKTGTGASPKTMYNGNDTFNDEIRKVHLFSSVNQNISPQTRFLRNEITNANLTDQSLMPTVHDKELYNHNVSSKQIGKESGDLIIDTSVRPASIMSMHQYVKESPQQSHRDVEIPKQQYVKSPLSFKYLPEHVAHGQHNPLLKKMHPPEISTEKSQLNTALYENCETVNVEPQDVEPLKIKKNEKVCHNTNDETEFKTLKSNSKKYDAQTPKEMINEDYIAYVNSMSEAFMKTNIKSDSDNKPNPVSNDEKDVKINVDHKNDDVSETRQVTEEETEKEHPSKQSDDKFNPQIEASSDVNQELIYPENYAVSNDVLSGKNMAKVQDNAVNLEVDLDQDITQTYDPNYQQQYAPTGEDQYAISQMEPNQFAQYKYEHSQIETDQYGQYQYNQSQPETNLYQHIQPKASIYEQSQTETNQYEQSQLKAVEYEQSQPEPVQDGQYQYEQSQYEQIQSEKGQPETNQYEQSYPETNQLTQSQIETGQYRQVQYDQSQPEINQYQHIQPEPSPYEHIQSEGSPYEQSQTETIQYEQSQPETEQVQDGQYQYGQSQPETNQYQHIQSETSPYEQSQLEAVQYDQSQPETNQYEQIYPETNEYEQVQSETNQYGQVQDEASPYEQSRTETKQYEQSQSDIDQYRQVQDEQYQYEEDQLEINQYQHFQSEASPYEQSQLEGVQFEQSQPETNQYEQSQPETNQYEQSQPETNQYAQSQPETNQYEQSQPETNQYAQIQPETNQYELSQPETNQYEQSQHETNQYEQSQPGTNQYEQVQDGQYQIEHNESETISHDQNVDGHYQYQDQSETNQYEQNEVPVQLTQYQTDQFQYGYNQQQPHANIEDELCDALTGAYSAQMNPDTAFEDKVYEELNGALTAHMQDGYGLQTINQLINQQ